MLGGEGNDKLGFSSAFISKFQERTVVDPESLEEVTDIRPDVVTELAFAVEARPGQQIPL